jgi:hypothetical protein
LSFLLGARLKKIFILFFIYKRWNKYRKEAIDMISIGANGERIAYGIKHYNLDTEADLQ